MNNKMKLLDDYVDYLDRSFREHANFVDVTKKQKTYFKKLIGFFVIIVSLFSFSLLNKYLNE